MPLYSNKIFCEKSFRNASYNFVWLSLLARDISDPLAIDAIDGIDGESTDNDVSIRYQTAEIVDFYERPWYEGGVATRRVALHRSYKFERRTPYSAIVHSIRGT